MTTLDGTFTATLAEEPRQGRLDLCRHARLPAATRARIGKQAGDTVTVHLDERLARTPRRSPR